MTKTLLALSLAVAAATPAVASDAITDVHTSKYNSGYVEAHFTRPDNWNGEGSCVVQVREANYPNTVFYQTPSRSLPGSPVDFRQWADFNIHPELRPVDKQFRIVCETAAGTIQSLATIVTPPKVTQNLSGEISADGKAFTISGNIYVEGNAPGTWCEETEQNVLHGNSIFSEEFATYGGFHAASIPTTGAGDLYYGYGQTKFECHGKGGTSLYLLEYQANFDNGLDFELKALTHY